MSSVVISGDTSGAITLSAPAVAGTNTITLPASTGTVVTTGTPQSGSVIQTVSTTKTDTFTMTGQTQTAITGLTATITPKFSTSTILVMVTIGGYSQGTGQGRFILTRAGSNIGVGAAGSGQLQVSFGISGPSSGAPMITGGITYLDSPATTSSTTYGVTVSSNDAGAAIYINRSVTDSGSTSYQRSISTITVMEIAA